jgi:hypothetical protein
MQQIYGRTRALVGISSLKRECRAGGGRFDAGEPQMPKTAQTATSVFREQTWPPNGVLNFVATPPRCDENSRFGSTNPGSVEFIRNLQGSLS